VSKNNVRVNNFNYTITSSDGKSANWWTDQNGDNAYDIGRWAAGTVATVSLINPDPGYGCSWSFHSDPNDPSGPTARNGGGCSAAVTIGSGAYSADWQNHLWFNLTPATGTISANPNPCGTASNGLCTSTISWSSNASSGEVCVSNSDNSHTTSTVFAGGSNGSQAAPWIALGKVYRFYLRTPGNGTCAGSLLSQVDVTALQPPVPLTATCPSPGTTATMTWSGPSNATNYPIRVNNETNGWNGYCNDPNPPNPGDICLNNLPNKSYSFSSTPGVKYSWWVHACTAQTCTYGVLGPSFTCLTPTPTPTPTPIPPSLGTLNVVYTANSGVEGAKYGISGLKSDDSAYPTGTGSNWNNDINITQNINNADNAHLAGVAFTTTGGAANSLNDLITKASTPNDFIMIYANCPGTPAGSPCPIDSRFTAGSYRIYHNGAWRGPYPANQKYTTTQFDITPKEFSTSPGSVQLQVQFKSSVANRTWTTYGYARGTTGEVAQIKTACHPSLGTCTSSSLPLTQKTEKKGILGFIYNLLERTVKKTEAFF